MKLQISLAKVEEVDSEALGWMQLAFDEKGLGHHLRSVVWQRLRFAPPSEISSLTRIDEDLEWRAL